MNAKICVMALLCHFLSSLAYAQALKVGDKIPDELWDLPLQVVNHPEGRDTIRLGEYKDKLIILDFWATWCGACIKKFPETGLLQEEFNSYLKFVGISNESYSSIHNFINKYRKEINNRYVPLTTIKPFEFEEKFPYRGMPHFVWILDGNVTAITGEKEVTEQNIKTLLTNKKISLPVKFEILNYKASKPLFIDGNGGEITGNFYRSLLTGKIEGLQKIITVTNPNTGRKIEKLTCINCSLLDLFLLVNPEIVSWPKTRLFVEGKSFDPNKFYSYELNTPPLEIKSLYTLAKNDFEKYLGAKGWFEEKELECIIVKVNDLISKSYSKGGEKEDNFNTTGGNRIIKNYPIKSLIAYFNNNTNKFFYIDETLLKKNLDLSFPEDITNFDQLKISLLQQGLVLEREMRTVKVFVVNVNSNE